MSEQHAIYTTRQRTTPIRMQTTTITLTNSEVQLIKHGLDMLNEASLGFENSVRDIFYKLRAK